jgi:hypothetical protein
MLSSPLDVPQASAKPWATKLSAHMGLIEPKTTWAVHLNRTVTRIDRWMTKPDPRCALENPSLHFLCPDPSVRERRGVVRRSDRGGGAPRVRSSACMPTRWWARHRWVNSRWCPWTDLRSGHYRRGARTSSGSPECSRSRHPWLGWGIWWLWLRFTTSSRPWCQATAAAQSPLPVFGVYHKGDHGSGTVNGVRPDALIHRVRVSAHFLSLILIWIFTENWSSPSKCCGEN